MKVSTTHHGLTATSSDVLVIGVFSGSLSLTASVAEADEMLGGSLACQAEFEHFTGKVGQVLVQFSRHAFPCNRIMLLGLGDRNKLDVKALRRAIIKGFREVKKLKAASVSVAPIELADTKLTSYQLGESLAAYAGMIDYTINHQKTDHIHHEEAVHVAELTVLSNLEDAADLASGLDAGAAFAQGVTLARNLSNEPACDCTPQRLAGVARTLAETCEGIEVTTFDKAQLEHMGAGALLAVNKGSALPPVLIMAKYTPKSGATKEVLGYVGKSITFDSGGLDLKPAEGMRHMKRDMSGGAVVLGALSIIAKLQLPISVTVVMAATENMIDGKAAKPGDIIKTLAGITVEEDNTDAEGRLTLADAIAFAKKHGVTRIVDVATLTGAVKQIGGDVAAGLFGNDAAYQAELVTAAEAADEHVQPMIMWDELRDLNKSEMGDLKNSGGPLAGSTTAAWFIREFAGATPWLHLDIAGVAYRDRELGADPKGATGFGVRTLVELARLYAARSN